MGVPLLRENTIWQCLGMFLQSRGMADLAAAQSWACCRSPETSTTGGLSLDVSCHSVSQGVCRAHASIRYSAQENGPLLVNATGGLMRNPYAWTKQANLLILESRSPSMHSRHCCPQSPKNNSGSTKNCQLSPDPEVLEVWGIPTAQP